MAQIFPIDFDEKLTIAQDDFILFSDSEDGNKIKKAQYSNLKGEKGNTGTAATITVGSTTTGNPGTSASVVNSGTTSAAVLDFTIPEGEKGDTGETGASIVSAEFDGDNMVFTKDDGDTVTLTDAKVDLKGDTGDAATITVGTTTTLSPGSSATVTNSGTSGAAVFNFGIPEGEKGDQGEKGEAATISVGTTTTGEPGTSASVTNSGTTSDAVFNFTIPKGAKGDTGDTGTAATIAVGTTTTGEPGTDASVTNSGTSSAAVFDFTIPQGEKGDTGTAATIAVGTVTTGAEGSSATVTNSGTSSAAVFDFSIPKGDTGATGSAATISVGTTSTLSPGSSATVTNSGTSSAAVFDFGIPQGQTGATGNGISSVTTSKSGKVTTVTMNYTDGSTPTTFQVSDGQDGEGSGDVIGPASSTDGNVVLFDGVTGKLIKDSGKTIPATASDVNALPDSTKYGASITVSVDTTDYKITTTLKDQDGNTLGTAQVIDLPLESVVVSGSYDSATKKVILTLQNGSTIEFSVADLVSGLQAEITSSNKLDADLVDDSTSTNKFVTASDKTTWSGKQDALIAGTNIQIAADGKTISATDTTYSAASSSTLGLVKLGDDTVQSVAANAVSGTANRTYAIQTNSSDQLVVNVPWENTTYSRQSPASGGTTLSLVNTGDMYTWNNKADTSIVNDTAYGSGWDSDTTHAPSKNAVYDKISDMDTIIGGKITNPSGGTEGQVLTKSSNGETWSTIESGASDHLGQRAPVGELYTLSDDMFLQSTPALADSSMDQAVGNTADNTQIHIQRVSSGTASNKLKLKVKKVGSPGDLTVQVMKGISVVVTADVEAYWYGDSSNTIATGTLSSSSVTTSFQELEVTLNANFGGTKEELLNIVLSQASVDASNYYAIACDGTQWSEAFSFVAVNGNTRTRSKIMPYCTSDAFAQSLFCKVSDEQFAVEHVIADNLYVDGGSSTHTFYGASIPFAGKLEWGITKHSYNAWAVGRVNGGQIFNATETASGTSDVQAGTFEIRGYGQWTFNFKLTAAFDKPITSRIVLPRELKALGSKIGCTLFGLHIDNTWYTGE